MARLGTHPIGFELQTNTSGVEWTTSTGGAATSTTQKYGGAASLRCNPTAATSYITNSFRADTVADFYWKFMLYIATGPSAKTTISGYGDSASFYGAKIRLGTDLKLYADNSGLTSETAGSTTLSTGTWYRIEGYYNETANTLTVKLATGDGTASTEINAGAVDDIGGGGRVTLGVVDSTTADLYFDDLVADDAGYPGPGRVVIAVPTGAGDNAATTGVYSYINEIPISNTATSGSTMVELDSNGVIGDYAMTDSSTLGIGASDTINAVAVVARIREEAAGTSSYNLRIKSASGGTVTASSNGDGGNATARTNPTGTTALARILYTVVDPTTSSAWTPTGTNSIDNMQVGVANVDGDSTPDLWVLGLYAMVEYVPSNNVSVTPGVASLTLTAYAPTVTVSDNKSITTASPTAFTLTAQTPTVTINTIITPDIATLTLTAYAPTVTYTENISITTATPGSFTITPWTPTVAYTDNVAVTPGIASLSLTPYAPTVVATANQFATPGVASLTLTPYAPTVDYTANVAVTPGTASLTITPWSPTVAFTDHVAVTPGVASLTITPYAPTVAFTDHVTVTPGTASLSLTAQQPTVTTGDNQSFVPGTASLTLTAYAPTVAVSDHKVVTPDTAALTITAQQPTVTYNQILTPDLGTLSLTAYSPTVSVSDNISVAPGTASLNLTAYEPTVGIGSQSVTLTPGVASLVLAMFAPTVTVSDNKSVTPGPATLRLRGYAPIINGIVPERNYYIDSSGNIYWVISQTAGLVEKV